MHDTGSGYLALIPAPLSRLAPSTDALMDVEKGKFIEVSESAIKLFKMSKEDLLKIGPLEVSPEFQPDGRLSSESAIENIQNAVAGNKPVFETKDHTCIAIRE